MTVLSRSKNAAARVTRHDCKWTGLRRRGPRAVHTRTGHPQFGAGSGAVCPRSSGLGAVSAARTARPPVRPPARRQRRRGAPRRPPPAARRGRRRARAGHRRSGAAPGPPGRAAGPGRRRRARRRGRAGAAAPARRGRRGRAASCRPPSGPRRSSSAPSGWRCCPDDESWLLARSAAAVAVAGRARPAGRRGRQLRGRRGEHGGRRRWRWPPRRASSSSTPTRGERGWTCSWAPSASRGCAGRSSPGCAGGSAGTRCSPPCPRSTACTSSPRPGRLPSPVPDEALTAVVEAARAVGRPGRRRSAAPGRAAAARRRCSPTPTSPSWSSRPGCGRPRRRGCWWRRRARGWSAARLVVRQVPGGLVRGTRSPTSCGRPVLADLPHDRSAVPRGERGRAARGLGAVPARVASPGGSSPRCAPRDAAVSAPGAAGPGPRPAGPGAGAADPGRRRRARPGGGRRAAG